MLCAHALVSLIPNIKNVWVQEILALNACHAEHPVAKFWGTCNQHKWNLDRCLREEKVLKRCCLLCAGQHKHSAVAGSEQPGSAGT